MTKGKGQISEDDAKKRFWRGLGDLVQIEGSAAPVALLGQTLGLPLQRGLEGIGQRVFRRRKIARARGEKRDELAVAPSRRLFGGVARKPVVFSRLCHIVQSGRTSIAPLAAPGQRAAQLSA